jgi:NAD(P)-dependent dehydrogenase (short-subunit alcohol dehydrogenase family)
VIYKFRIKKKELRKMGRLENKVALVTGASSGMGYEIAKLFAKEGASVVVIARRKEKLAALIAQIEADSGKGIAVAGDVTSEDDVQHAVKTAVQEFGKLDIVVNNAGILDKMRPVTEVDDDLWNAVINVNLTGPMRLFRAAIPEMEKSGGGVFVTVASLGGLKAGIAGSAYIASKHGVLGLAKNVAYMYAKKNIRSNVIAPGGVNTEMGTNVEGNSEMGMERSTLGMGTMPRMGEPEEIAQLALFLASDDASLINGAVVTADAGWGCY